MKRIAIYIFLLLLVSSCEQSSILDSQEEQESGSITTRSNYSISEYSMFQNIVRYTSAASASMTGDIYCPEQAEYTFMFSFRASPGVNYYAYVGDLVLYPSNGSSFRTVTAKLKAGTNTIDVGVNFSGANQQAEVRLVIEKINGNPLYSEEGYCDLAFGASSELADLGGGSEAYHWMCGSCRMLNSMSTSSCIACGERR